MVERAAMHGCIAGYPWKEMCLASALSGWAMFATLYSFVCLGMDISLAAYAMTRTGLLEGRRWDPTD